MSDTSSFQPLRGLRILDLSRLIPGAAVTRNFADLGADVIKIEAPPIGDWLRDVRPIVDGLGLPHLVLDRNKRSLALDLRRPEGRAVFEAMLQEVDAIVEVSRPGAMAELGADFASVQRINPRVVYLSFTGFGSHSPYEALPTHGMNLASFAGVHGYEHRDGRVVPGPLPWGRYRVPLEMTALQGAFALLAALRERDETGVGRHLDVPIVQSLMVGDEAAFTDWLNTESFFYVDLPQPMAGQGMWVAEDGKILAACPLEQRFWVKFCEVLERPDLATRGDWEGHEIELNTDVELYDEVAKAIALRPRDVWLKLLTEARIPCAPVNTVEEALDDDHLGGRLVVEVTHPRTGEPVRMLKPSVFAGGDGLRFDARPAPQFGQQSVAVLTDLGVKQEFVEAAIAAGAVVQREDEEERS